MTNAAGLPFDDIRALIRMMPGPDEEALEAARARAVALADPPDVLGEFGELATWVAGWQGKGRPTVQRPLLAVFASSHGIAPDGEAGRARMDLLAAGGGAINQVCATYDLGLKVFDLALDVPTDDFTKDAALDEAACAATMAFGMEAIAGGSDLLGLGAIGGGGAIAAAAIAQVLYGGSVDEWLQSEVAAERQTAGLAIAQAMERHRGHLKEPLEILRRVGGRDLAAIAGAILAGRLQRIPVILDGYVATAAAALLHQLDTAALDHCIVGHAAPGPHAAMVRNLGLKPLLQFGLRGGEGLGAALAAGVIKAAVNCHNDMATG